MVPMLRVSASYKNSVGNEYTCDNLVFLVRVFSYLVLFKFHHRKSIAVMLFRNRLNWLKHNYCETLRKKFECPKELILIYLPFFVSVTLKGECEGKVFQEGTFSFVLGEGSEYDIPENLEKALEKFKYKEKSRLFVQPQHLWSGKGNDKLGVPSNKPATYTITMNNFEKVTVSYYSGSLCFFLLIFLLLWTRIMYLLLLFLYTYITNCNYPSHCYSLMVS